MPFCKKCGLFFAKGNECSCVTGGDPAEAARSKAAPAVVAPSAAAAVPAPKPASARPSWSTSGKRREEGAPARPVRSYGDEDRGAVVSERTSTSNKYCSGCSEPKSLCKCTPDEGVPFYGRNKAEPAAPVNSAAFCESCQEPRSLCTCRKTTAAESSHSSGRSGGVSAREESDRQYAEPARGGRGGAEVVSEGSVMGGSNFCASCGE
jgi:hypothetical protein